MFYLYLWSWLQLQLVICWAVAQVFDQVSLIRFPSEGLACSPGINIHVLNDTMIQFEGTGVFTDLTGNAILCGGTGINADAGKSARNYDGV